MEQCGLCDKYYCGHHSRSLSDGIWTCTNCGNEAIPSIYCLPFLDGEVNFDSDCYRSVCKECHDKYEGE